jgi:hypothetical protein
MLARGGTLPAVEGFNLTVDMLTNPPRLGGQTNIIQTDIPAENGAIHVVDNLLDPFVEYFGVSNARATIASGPPVAIPGVPAQQPEKKTSTTTASRTSRKNRRDSSNE